MNGIKKAVTNSNVVSLNGLMVARYVVRSVRHRSSPPTLVVPYCVHNQTDRLPLSSPGSLCLLTCLNQHPLASSLDEFVKQ